MFPAGYGDFAIQSSDGLVCHIPRHLLSHLSEFFSDMFLVAEESRGGEKPLEVSESGQILELLLQHMDPNRQAPPIQADTVVDLLEAARKYRIPSIGRAFENEIQFDKIAILGGQRHDSLAMENPLLVLYCAYQFELPEAGRVALHAFRTCRAASLRPADLSPSLSLPLNVYSHAMGLRDERIEQLQGLIAKLADFNKEYGRDSKDQTRRTCAKCTRQRAEWVLRISRAIHTTPTWEALREAFDSGSQRCIGCGMESWADSFYYLPEQWEESIKGTEYALPAWPFSSRLS